MSEEYDDNLFDKAKRLDISNELPIDVNVKYDTDLDPVSCKHIQVINKQKSLDLKIEFIRSFTSSGFDGPVQIQPSDFKPLKYWRPPSTGYYYTYKEYRSSYSFYILNPNWVIFPIILIKDTSSTINWTIPRFIIFNRISSVENIKTELDNYNYDDVYVLNDGNYYYLKNGENLVLCEIYNVEYLPVSDLINSYSKIYIYKNLSYIRVYNKWVKLYNFNDIISLGDFKNNSKQISDILYNKYTVFNADSLDKLDVKYKYLYNLDNYPTEIQNEVTVDKTKFKKMILLPNKSVFPSMVGWYTEENFPDIGDAVIGRFYGLLTGEYGSYEYTALYLATMINGEKQYCEIQTDCIYYKPAIDGNVTKYEAVFITGNDISQSLIEVHNVCNIIFNQDNPDTYYNYGINIEELDTDDLYELSYYIDVYSYATPGTNEVPVTYISIFNVNVNEEYDIAFAMAETSTYPVTVYNSQMIKIHIPEDVNFNSIYIDGNVPKAFQIPYDNEYIYSMIPSQVLKMTVQPAIHKAISDDVLHTVIKYSDISKTNDLPNDYWDLTSNSKDLELDESPSYSVAPSFPTACDIVISNLKNKNYDIPSINFKFDYYVDIAENDVPYEICRNNTASTSIYSYNPYRMLKNTINNLNGSRIIDYGVIIEKVFFGSTNKPIDLTVNNPDSGCIALEEFLNTRILSKLLLNNNGYGNTHMNKFKLYLEINGSGVETTVRNGTVIFSSALKMTHAYMDLPIQIGHNTYYGLEIILEYDDGSTQYQLQAYAAINSNDPSVKYQSLAKMNPDNCIIGVKGNSTLPFDKMQIKLIPYELYNSTFSMSLYMTFLINSNIKKYINDEIDEEVDRGAGLIGDLFDLPDDLSELDLDDLTFTSNYVNLVLVRANGRREFISKQFVMATDPSTREKYLSLYVGSDENSDPDEEYAYYSVNLYITSDNGSCKLYIKSEYFNQTYSRGDDPIDYIEFNDQYGNPTTVTITINDRG